jgi:hypothetical protein
MGRRGQNEREDHRRTEAKEDLGQQVSNEVAYAKVEFSCLLKEFADAVKYLLAGTSRTRQDWLEKVDVNAGESDVDLVSTGASSAFPAEVRTSGYARVPLPVFDRISRAIRTLGAASVRISIETGTIKVSDDLVFAHPEITLRLIGARIADLPIDAPLPDVLVLEARFRPEEIEDSGLLARVLSAREQASKLIDRAMPHLKPLGIERAALAEFIAEQIAARARHKK